MQGEKKEFVQIGPIYIAVSFAIGVVWNRYIAVPVLLPLVCLPVVTALYFLLRERISNSDISSVAFVIILFFLIGNLSASVLNRRVPRLACLDDTPSPVVVYGRFMNPSLLQHNAFTFTVVTDSFLYKNRIRKGAWRFHCTMRSYKSPLEITSRYRILKEGQHIAVTGKISDGGSARNPGEFHYGNYLLEQGVNGAVQINEKDTLVVLEEEYAFFDNLKNTARTIIAERIDKFMNDETAGLVKGLLLGDRSGIDQDVQKNFINAGVAHVLAVSGLNVAFLGYMVLLLLHRFRISVQYIGMLTAMILFWFVAGNSPPVNRAVIMGGLIVLQVLLGRDVHIMNTLASTAFFSLLFSPADLFTASFQLSFSGVFALIYAYPVLERFTKNIKQKRIRKVLQLVLLTFAAQLGTMPFTCYYFGKISLTAIAANTIIVPLISFVMGGALISLGAGVLSFSLGLITGNGVNLLVRAVYYITHVSGGDSAWIAATGYTISVVAASIILFFVYVETIRRCKNVLPFVLITILLTGIIWQMNMVIAKPMLSAGKMHIVFADVGQGDASIIVFPHGASMLIDAGNATDRYDTGKERLLPLLNYLQINRLDYAIITHYDADHYKGMAALLRAGKIARLFVPPGFSKIKSDSLIRQLATLQGATVQIPVDTVWHLENVRGYFMANEAGYRVGETLNDRCITIKLQYGNTAILFTGDAQDTREKFWLEHIPALLRSQVLKIAHHGSKYGTSDAFLEAVHPGYAVISCGRNNTYHHPHAELLQRLETRGVLYDRTDRKGAVILTTDGCTIDRFEWRQ